MKGRGMVYADIEQLQTTIGEKKTAIDGIIQDLVAKVGEVQGVYIGDAADAFASSVNTLAETMQPELDTLLTQLETIMHEKELAYQQQENNLSGGGTPSSPAGGHFVE